MSYLQKAKTKKLGDEMSKLYKVEINGVVMCKADSKTKAILTTLEQLARNNITVNVCDVSCTQITGDEKDENDD